MIYIQQSDDISDGVKYRSMRRYQYLKPSIVILLILITDSEAVMVVIHHSSLL
ncbi:hypothetical protein EC236275_1902 [Escherichia coli 2362-75]|nr:hypothetical protein EC236275_1902 [Escherichia coli 2362-75]